MNLKIMSDDELNELRDQARHTVNATGWRDRATMESSADLIDSIDNELYERETN
jgi:hypothetical protein